MTRIFVFISLVVISMTSVPLIMSGQTSKPARPYGEPGLVQDFLCSEVEYPQSALDHDLEGTVLISFIVERDGTVSGTRIKQSVSPELDAEAIRLFRMILWEPAISLGQPVASEMEFPVKFNIKKYHKHCKLRGYERTELPFEPVDTSLKVYELSQVDKAPYPLFSEKGMNMGKFISTNIRYPETAYRQNLSGNVVLRFVVEPHGRPSNIMVINPVGGGCTQEAIRLLQQLRWMPALKSGTAVRCFNKLEIEFKLPDESDMKMFENTQMNSN